MVNRVRLRARAECNTSDDSGHCQTIHFMMIHSFRYAWYSSTWITMERLNFAYARNAPPNATKINEAMIVEGINFLFMAKQ